MNLGFSPFGLERIREIGLPLSTMPSRRDDADRAAAKDLVASVLIAPATLKNPGEPRSPGCTTVVGQVHADQPVV